MREKMFSKADIAAWTEALDVDKPAELDDGDFTALPQVEAMRAQVLNVGMLFRLRTRDNQVIDFLANPVAARHMAACILKMGQTAGWLDSLGDVTIPDRPLFDA